VGVLTVDPNKNIFVFDEGNDKIKMIANDANRTVSTVAKLQGDMVWALTYLKGKIYAVGSDGSVDLLLSIADPPAPFDAAHPRANLVEIFAERGHFPEIPASKQAVLKSLTTDGDALITASEGYVWRLSTDGTVLGTVGGTGDYFGSFPTNFDLTVGHAARDWPLYTNGPGWDVWLTFKAGKLYWSGGSGLGKNVVQFSCP
jgi:hypothetical protein